MCNFTMIEENCPHIVAIHDPFLRVRDVAFIRINIPLL
jgi:hypothetical protein